MYSWLGWKLDETLIKHIHKSTERTAPTRPKVCGDEEYNTWVGVNVTNYIKNVIKPGYKLPREPFSLGLNIQDRKSPDRKSPDRKSKKRSPEKQRSFTKSKKRLCRSN